MLALVLRLGTGQVGRHKLGRVFEQPGLPLAKSNLAFDQTTLSLENICNALLDFLEVDARMRTIRSQVATIDKQWDKFLYLLENFEKQGVTPFFIFDNLESFQPDDDPGIDGAAPRLIEQRDGFILRLQGSYCALKFGSFGGFLPESFYCLFLFFHELLELLYLRLVPGCFLLQVM